MVVEAKMAAFGESFKMNDRVGIDYEGTGKFIGTGRVCGIASIHILDYYIVQLDEPIAGFVDSTGIPWTAISMPNTCLKRL